MKQTKDSRFPPWRPCTETTIGGLYQTTSPMGFFRVPWAPCCSDRRVDLSEGCNYRIAILV
jgi:hypothetical protein